MHIGNDLLEHIYGCDKCKKRLELRKKGYTYTQIRYREKKEEVNEDAKSK